MGLLAAGQVVVLPFPYTDLSGSKHRPALLLACSGREDWIACQITSNPKADSLAIELSLASFSSGGLRHTSYARPGKLFTAHESLIAKQAGILTRDAFLQVRDAAVSILRPS